jgi:hypothetical protein
LFLQIGFFVLKLVHFLKFKGTIEIQPLSPTPKTRPYKLPKFSPINKPTPYFHQSTKPKRLPQRSARVLNTGSTRTQRQIILPALPKLIVPSSNHSSNRIPVPIVIPTLKPSRKKTSINDLVPPRPQSSIPQTKPPEIKPLVNGTRVMCPKKYLNFSAKSSELPAKISINYLNMCSDILTLGYYCAASDQGSVTTQEDDYLKSWSWCVYEKTSDIDFKSFYETLSDTQVRAVMQGRQKLDVLSKLAERIRKTGEKKFIQSAGHLCSEIIRMR